MTEYKNIEVDAGIVNEVTGEIYNHKFYIKEFNWQAYASWGRLIDFINEYWLNPVSDAKNIYRCVSISFEPLEFLPFSAERYFTLHSDIKIYHTNFFAKTIVSKGFYSIFVSFSRLLQKVMFNPKNFQL